MKFADEFDSFNEGAAEYPKLITPRVLVGVLKDLERIASSGAKI
jgi:hypothetical protein